MADSLWVFVPHEQAHGACSILKEVGLLSPDGIKARAVKNVMKLIANSPGAAKVAPAKMAREAGSEREREREEFHESIQPALAYEDASLLESSATVRMAARQWQTAFWSLCHTKHCMVPSASRYNDPNWRRMWAKWGQSKTKCLSSPNALVPHKVQRRRCRGTAGLASLPCSTGKACGIASAAVHWKWALEAQTKAQFSADWDAETMQSMCRVLPFWRELFLGTHADHPKPCRADPSCSPETQGSSGRLCQKTKTARPCQGGCIA